MKRLVYFLATIIVLTACSPSTVIPTATVEVPPSAIPPTPEMKPSPTPSKVEINGGTYTQKAGRDFEAFDSSGKLAYVRAATIKGVPGEWIKFSHEVAFPTADWTGLPTNLGADYSLNQDKTGIVGVDGLTINNKGEATVSVDGVTKETFSINDIHTVTKDINGQPIKGILLVSGYAWNPETKSWDVYNPGFPMDVPKDELGWFNSADIANGNWLRWYQRATAKVDWKALFAKALHPDSWKFVESNMKDGTNTYHLDWLTWVNNDLVTAEK